MFENLTAVLSPKSFNLEKYLTSSEQYTNIKPRLVKLIEKILDGTPSMAKREGACAKSTACSGTLVSITDEALAKHLYVVINKESFFDYKLKFVYNLFSCFSDLKFFVDKKQQKVVFVYYKCSMDRSHNFLSTLFDSLQYIRDLFSTEDDFKVNVNTEDYKININYEDFFSEFLSRAKNTSFLTAFFTSIVPDEYEFTSERLYGIATAFICWYNNESFKTRNIQAGSLKTTIPGMYIYSIDRLYNHSPSSRSISINILKLCFNPNAFNSYAEFFADYKATERVQSYYSRFITDEYFVFDENLLQNSLDMVEDADKFTVFTLDKNGKYVVVKVKDSNSINDYLFTLNHCVECNLIDNMFVVPNPDKSCYYLLFALSDSQLSGSQTICTAIKNGKLDNKSIATLIQSVGQANWSIGFTPSTDLLECFKIASGLSLQLDPCCISKIDFTQKSSNNVFRLFVLQLVKTFVEINEIDIKKIYSCCFMNVLPPTFANKLLEYLKTGVCDVNDTNSWGDILHSCWVTKVVFLENTPKMAKINPDKISFVSEVQSNSSVQKIIAKKSQAFSKDYINFSECFNFVNAIGFNLCDYTLDKLFLNADIMNYLTPAKVIVSKDFLKDGSYQIIGIVWNHYNLRKISQLISENAVDTKVLYTMICSLHAIRHSHSFTINEFTLPDMLVTSDNEVVLNRNVAERLTYRRNLTEVQYFNSLFVSFRKLFDDNVWYSLEHFTFNQLSENGSNLLAAARHMSLCKEHNHYHLQNTLCPDCQKIYSIVKNPDASSEIYRNSAFWFFSLSGNRILAVPSKAAMYALAIPSEKTLFADVKLGLESELYANFLFKPSKIAIFNSIPYGFVFNSIDFSKLLPLDKFNNMQRLKVILVMYKKLLPHILDGSFVSVNPNIYASIAMHRDYKGEILILNLPIMKCSTVLQENKQAQIEATKRAFANFLINYITSDDALNLASQLDCSGIKDLVDDIKKLNFDERVLRDCLNKFCHVHKIPFSTKYDVCPLCENDGISKSQMVIMPSSYFAKLTENESPYEGGEATLYPDGNGEIQKVFKPVVDLELKSRIIGKALQKAPMFNDFNQSHPDIQFVTISKVLYESDSKSIKLKGFKQQLIEDSFKISSLRDKEFVNAQGYTRSDIVDILIKVCIGIEFLHSIGGYIGDLNGGNILIKGKTVYFIDMDGMSFDDVKNFVYTDTYIYPPSAKNKNITQADDWYSLAIQAFYYFTYSHPFRGICGNSKVPENEVDRMTLGLSVLGNHGIKVPNISIGWDFLPKSLIDFFLNTFEGTKRESMRKVLESFSRQVDKDLTRSLEFQELPRKFPCQFALSYNSYIASNSYLVWCETELIYLGAGNIRCKKTGDCFVLFTPTQTIVLNDRYGTISAFSPTAPGANVWGANGKLFYVDPNDNELHVKSVSKTTNTEMIVTISRATTNEILSFLVTDNNKFIFLEKEDDSHLAIYCNLVKLTSIAACWGLDANFANILYDETSDSYLVLASGKNGTLGVAIFSDGTYDTFSLEANISSATCFFKNTLYYISGDKIYFYNIRNGKTNCFTSSCVCQNSLIERKGNHFVICSVEKTHMYVKS